METRPVEMHQRSTGVGQEMAAPMPERAIGMVKLKRRFRRLLAIFQLLHSYLAVNNFKEQFFVEYDLIY